MRNLLIEISYNGARYHGYQIQKNSITITKVIQDAIFKVIDIRENIIGCSRTDAKVHSNSYFFNMHTLSKIPIQKFINIMNRVLPDDIILISCKEVDDKFHARYHCKSKEYIYKIHNCRLRNPFNSDLYFSYENHIDEVLLNNEAQQLVGKHDFTSFCSLGYKKGLSMIRTVESISVDRDGDFVFFTIKADGFLYHMVRNIVGTLLFINEGKTPKNTLKLIIEQKDRTKAGRTAPPQGLYLNKVEY